MWENAEYITVGYIRDAHGIKGEVFIRLFAGEAVWLSDLKQILLRNKDTGEIQAKKFTRIKPHKDGLIVSLEGVSTRNLSEDLIGLQFIIPQSFLISKPGEDIYLNEIKGFSIIDEQKGEIGCVESFVSNGAQDLLVIKVNDKEVLIPFVKALVKEVDYNKRSISMTLPEGLIEVNLD